VPEGHVLHRLAGEQQELVGSSLRVSSPQGRFTDGAARLDGCRLDGVEAVARALWDTLAGMMRRGVEDEPIRRVRKRERCAACDAEVVTLELGGRTAYVCPAQQPAA
jgi:hypothetical protein